MSETSLVAIEQKEVAFYGDDLTAVRVQDGTVYVPMRPLCNLLGLQWSAQSKRMKRDPVLSEATVSMSVMDTQSEPHQRRNMTCLPLDYVSGFLFGISASRAKPEIQERLVRYQRECYRVLNEAFQNGELTADSDFDTLLQQADNDAVQAYQMAQAIMKLARHQILMQAQIQNHEERLEQIEAVLGDPGRHVTPDQASQISQAVKAIAMEVSKQTKSNAYGGVYGELYRRFGITSYKQLPAKKYQEAMEWLSDWHEQVTNKALPF
ncbi:MAG: phage antirepressor N-terminal domain-containing protein [Chloroflexota bacterium]